MSLYDPNYIEGHAAPCCDQDCNQGRACRVITRDGLHIVDTDHYDDPPPSRWQTVINWALAAATVVCATGMFAALAGYISNKI